MSLVSWAVVVIGVAIRWPVMQVAIISWSGSSESSRSAWDSSCCERVARRSAPVFSSEGSIRMSRGPSAL